MFEVDQVEVVKRILLIGTPVLYSVGVVKAVKNLKDWRKLSRFGVVQYQSSCCSHTAVPHMVLREIFWFPRSENTGFAKHLIKI